MESKHLSELLKQIGELESNVEELTFELAAKCSEYESLQETCIRYKKYNDNLEKMAELKREETANFRKRLTKMGAIILQRNVDNTDPNLVMEEIESRFAELQKQNKGVQSIVDNYQFQQHEIERLKNENRALSSYKEQVHMIQQQLSESEATVLNIRSELLFTLEKMKEKDDEIVGLKSVIEENEEESDNMQNEILEKDGIISGLSSEIESLNEELLNEKNRAESLNEELLNEKNRVESLNEELHQKDQSICSLRTSLVDSSSNLETMSNQLSSYEHDFALLLGSYDETSDSVDQLIEDYQSKVAYIQKLHDHIHSLELVNNQLQSEVCSLNSLLSAPKDDELLDAYAVVISDLSKKLMECSTYMQYLSDQQIDVGLQSSKLALELDISDLNDQLSALRLENDDLKKTLHLRDDALAECERLQSDYSQSIEKNKILAQDNSVLQNKVEMLQNELQSQQTALSKTSGSSEVKSLKNKLKQEKRKNTEFANQHSQLKQKYQQLLDSHTKQIFISLLSFIVLSAFIQLLHLYIVC